MLDWIRKYYERFKMVSVLLLPTQKPLIEWRDLANTGDVSEALRRASDALIRVKGEGVQPRDLGIALLTGPYVQRMEYKPFIVDIDNLMHKDTIHRLVKEGFVVVRSFRGIHIHCFIKDDVYLLRLYRLDESGRSVKAGEAASAMPHLWTSPPTVRRVSENKVVVYRFVLKDGSTSSSLKTLNILEPPETTLNDVMQLLEVLEAIHFEKFEKVPGAVDDRIKILASEEGVKKRPAFKTFEDFVAFLVGNPLVPPCIAVLTAIALYNAGYEQYAEHIIAAHKEALEYLVANGVVDPHTYRVKVGYRFLYSALYTLTLAHLIDDIKYDDIIDALSYAIEDWPYDEGQNLDIKLQYLLLKSSEGRVYPRYARLGVLGHQFEGVVGLCKKCVFRDTCVEGRSHAPWRVLRAILRARNIIYDAT